MYIEMIAQEPDRPM